METIVIIALAVGVLCVVASFFIKDTGGLESADKEKIVEEIRKKALGEDSINKVMSKVTGEFTDKLTDLADDKLGSSKDSMAEVANDKMIAINDMAGQLLEKIEQNHKEVIFLYDMLNEKNENLKDFSSKIDGMRKELESEEKRIRTLNSDIDEKIVKIKEVRQTVVSRPVNAQPKQRAYEQAEKKEQAVEEIKVKEEPKSEPKEEMSLNDKIIKMRNEGKTIVEISKTLSMGQGEVSLILDLYGR